VVHERSIEIRHWLEAHQADIESGKIRVYALDECHAQGGDICGYLWADRQERGEILVDNYRDSQTYFGALDCVNQEMTLSAAKTANSESTIEFVKRLKAKSGDAKLVLIWDGASYHRSKDFRQYLEQVNEGDDWQIHCLRLAPYAPETNPIENIWGQAKQMLRQMHHRCQSFKAVKTLFELFINHRLFTMPDINAYEAFSCLS
jgi:putative transposase